MGLLTKLKSLLGLQDDRSGVRRGESGVTIEREPDESPEPDSRTESAVKGVDTGTEESEGAAESSGLNGVEEAEPAETGATETTDTAETTDSTEGVTTEDVTTEDVTSEPAEADDAAETEQTAADEPEPTPEETMEESGAQEAEVIEESESTEEPAGEGEPLEDVKGIGSAYAERLRDAGVANVAELAEADPDRLAEETDLSEKRISSWVERANAR